MLRIRVIGGVGVEPGVAGPLSRGARESLAYLVVNGPSSRKAVAAALWPDSDEPQALYNLRRALSELRRALGPHSHRLDAPDRGRIELDLLGAEVDLHCFRDAIAAGDHGSLVALGGGTPLEGVSGAWAVAARRALSAEMAQGLAVAARSAAGRREMASAEGLLRATLAHARQPKSVWQSLVRLHSEAGDLKAARRILAECEAASFGPEPLSPPGEGGRRGGSKGAGSVSEGGRPLAPSPSPPVGRGESGGLVGREDVLARLAADLRGFRLVTLCGPGGMGKTSVALALAHDAQEFSDGVAFVELVGTTSVAEVRGAIERALGLRIENGAGWAQVVEWLSDRRTLVVLDNAEHVLAAVAGVASELLARTNGPRLLVTSRVPLGLPNERRRRLPPLRPSDAHALFATCAGMVDPEYAWSEDSARLCVQLDGIPLALELAAAQVGSVPLAHLSAGLAASLALDSLCDGRPERHRTMRATLQLSLGALAPELRERFVALSVFADGFSSAAAAALGLTPADLARLANVSLVEFDGERYRMLEPVRQLAAEELAHAGGETAARERHARWFADEARRAYDGPYAYDRDPRRHGEDRRRWLLDRANVRTALAYLGEGSDDALALWLVQLWYRLVEHSDPAIQAWLERLELQAPGGSRISAHWWLAVALATIWNDQGDRGRALLARLAPSLERENHDVVAEIGIALGERPLRDPADGETREGYEVATRTFERLGMREEVRYAKVTRAASRVFDEELSEADWREVAQIATESLERGEVRTHVVALRLLARRETTWSARRAILRRALALQQSVGHWAEVHTLRALGMAARELGSAEDEIEAWREAIRRGEEVGYVGTLAEAHLELARALLRGGRLPEMWSAMARCLAMIRAQARPAYLHLAITHLADFARLSGEAEVYGELKAYLRRASARGVFEPHPKFTAIYQDLVAPGEAPGSTLFATVDDVISWVEIRAAL